MSASRKKKLRKEQNAAHLTKKQQAAKKEERKLKAYTVTFWVVLALCVSIVLSIVLATPVNVTIDRLATAVVVGDHKLSTTELTYFYIDHINNWYSQYGSYATYFGLNTSTGLDDQVYDQDSGTTWADYFLDEAVTSAKNVYALCDAAAKAGFSLSDEDRESVDALYENLEKQAKNSKVSVSKYLQSIYGDCASEKSYKEYYECTVLASAYYSHYAEELKGTYTDNDLREFEKKEPYNYNSYTYASFYMSVDTFKVGGTKDDKGNTTYSEDEIKAAKDYLEKVKDELSAEGIDTVEKLNDAIAKMEDDFDAYKAEAEKKDDDKKEETSTDDKKEETSTDDKKEETSTDDKKEETSTDDKKEETSTDDKKDETSTDDKKEEEEEDKHSKATENKKVLYSKVSTVMQEWIRDTARKNGDIKAIPYETTSTDKDGKEVKELKGYYIVLFQECHDNTKAHGMTDVRHLLVKFEGGKTDSNTGKVTYTDAEKKKAKDEAEKLLKEWKDGEATEDSFAALANKHSDDGDGTTGGLYEDIYRGKMVTNFENWCFDEARKAGDTDIVETEYGYHIMYFVSGSEQNYRDYMITNDKLTEEVNAWQEALIKAISVEEKNLDRVDKDLVLGGNSSTSTDSHAGHNH